MNSEIRRAAQLCNCAEALEHLSEYLDSEMDERELERLRTHIEDCAQCLEALASEQSLRVVLRRSCAEVAPPSLRLRVLSQITVQRSTSR
ncbi:mycothiol system anti-sigma-R factor [Pseudactinotalea sp. Z1739]|uniref:mycothiol system anti-sigma-R factor n=1 Tax=Pseudactinotalea sp. Z1739 TaxID=3413028 RepID=UPI003C7B5818